MHRGIIWIQQWFTMFVVIVQHFKDSSGSVWQVVIFRKMYSDAALKYSPVTWLAFVCHITTPSTQGLHHKTSVSPYFTPMMSGRVHWGLCSAECQKLYQNQAAPLCCRGNSLPDPASHRPSHRSLSPSLSPPATTRWRPMTPAPQPSTAPETAPWAWWAWGRRWWGRGIS